MSSFDDDIGTSPDSIDLTPRRVQSGRAAKKRPWAAIIVIVIVVCAAGLVVTKFLTSAIDYYCNVDEIGTKSNCDSGHRLRIQGVVDGGSVADDGTATVFTVSFNGATLPVRYEGDPGGIFKECIPVVVHGVMNPDGVFEGDRIEVKHSNQYEAENPDRMAEAEGTECSQSA